MTNIFIIGGARSGKSRRAQLIAEDISKSRIFIATAEPFDEEMKDRIARHQGDRGQGWRTVEAPLDLVAALRGNANGKCVCVIDCLTVWLSNLMHHGRETEAEVTALCDFIQQSPAPIVLVSNEVGMGLAPDSALGRKFRDAQGRLNQQLADVCDRVEFVAAGLPLRLKG